LKYNCSHRPPLLADLAALARGRLRRLYGRSREIIKGILLGREGLSGQLSSVTVVAAFLAVMVTAKAIQSATMG
jgi:hypothetical protein